MTVNTPTVPDSTRQSGSDYKGALDAVAAIHKREAAPFAPYADNQRQFQAADVSTGGDTIAVADHGLFANDVVRLTTTGTLPGGFAVSTDYYVIASGLTANAFKLSASQGGAAIDITSTGSGTHTFIRTTDMKVAVAKGAIPAPAAKPTEVAAQQTSALSAPAVNPRYDILYVDADSGALAVATGAEAASPSDPAVPANKVAICRVALTVGMSQITNAALDDLRVLSVLGLGTMAFQDASAVAITGGTIDGITLDGGDY